MSAILRKTVTLSLIGHITAFSIFSFTFCGRNPGINYTNVSFLGSVLRKADLSSQRFKNTDNVVLNFKPDTSALDKVNREYALVLPQYTKPSVVLPLSDKKMIYALDRKPTAYSWKKEEPVIMLYPELPQNFLIYFKDRQRVHIELEFNVMTSAMTNTVSIKRKVSSGNLEADLFSMRYISHYLFIEQSRFVPNKWQTVKIDLSAKNEK
jgi:hypothetical protein